MAERVGFEPTVRLPAQRFSRPSRSTTPAPLRGTRQTWSQVARNIDKRSDPRKRQFRLLPVFCHAQPGPAESLERQGVEGVWRWPYGGRGACKKDSRRHLPEPHAPRCRLYGTGTRGAVPDEAQRRSGNHSFAERPVERPVELPAATRCQGSGRWHLSTSE